MDAGTGALATLIGSRVRAGPQARDWTLNTLADAAGVSRRVFEPRGRQ